VVTQTIIRHVFRKGETRRGEKSLIRSLMAVLGGVGAAGHSIGRFYQQDTANSNQRYAVSPILNSSVPLTFDLQREGFICADPKATAPREKGILSYHIATQSKTAVFRGTRRAERELTQLGCSVGPPARQSFPQTDSKRGAR